MNPTYITAFKVVSSVKAPVVVSWIELRRLRLENLESETVHIPNQYHRPQIGILRGCLLNAGIPDCQNLPTRFLDVCKGIVVAERENRSVTPRNQAYSFSGNGIARTDGFG